MQVQAFNQAMSVDAAAGAVSRPANGAFAAMLAGRVSVTDREAEARAAAQQLVASTLLLPILQQARQDPFRTEMFHGGFTEEAFGAQLDTELADRIAQSSRFDLVDQIARRLLRQHELPTSKTAPISPAALGSGVGSTRGMEIDLHG